MIPPHTESTARILELIALYWRANYGVVLPDRRSAALQIGTTLPTAVADWIGEANAAYLTACNPHSKPLADDLNARRMNDLRTKLREHGCRFIEGAGVVLGEAWSEPSVLVAALPLALLDGLAREFGQNAVLSIDHRGPPRLRVYRQDWFARVGFVDGIAWVHA